MLATTTRAKTIDTIYNDERCQQLRRGHNYDEAIATIYNDARYYDEAMATIYNDASYYDETASL